MSEHEAGNEKKTPQVLGPNIYKIEIAALSKSICTGHYGPV